MATAYDLKGSYPTVQALSPTLSIAIEYCTIQTKQHGIIANYPVQKDEFDKGTAGPLLTTFANGIEDIYNRSPVSGAVGTQQLDEVSGLLEDFVTYTVVYVPPGSSNTSITAEADVPVGLLSEGDVTISETLLAEAENIIQKVYDNLVSTANG